MPELPDVVAYINALQARIQGQILKRIRVASPFLLRSVEPAISEAEGKRVIGFHRLGKRIVLEIEGEMFLILHLMIAGRLHWKSAGIQIPKKYGLAAFDFASGTVLLTEAGSKRRVSLHLVRGREALNEHDRGGLEVLDADLEAFRQVLRRENHTLKRALTDPSLFSGIGNAYSDEILHRARLSPIKLTQRLNEDEIERLYHAIRNTLLLWIDRLQGDAQKSFPEKVTAFRPGMAVHGRYGKPCLDCGAPVQRIVYAENEANYCAQCQTGGRLLADRALSRLLKDDWPRTLEEMEERRNPEGRPPSGKGRLPV
ncbi:MAG: formamidopyrimidine-DNA glycosylase [Deltaproteobacteria bacterium]|nr:formamidopyrimidine-DNA glycosylase [Deltaproteobacteria bacterium]